MRPATAAEHADHDRDLRKHEPSLDRIVADIPKRAAVAKLIGYCEGICSAGVLSEQGEMTLRLHIAETLSAFEMPARAEREMA